MARVGILGVGCAVPAREVPANDVSVDGPAAVDSAAERSMFTAARGRRWLDGDERLEGLMAEAARRALADAGVDAAGIDRLYGYGLVSRYVSPNALYDVHRRLGLGAGAWVVPIASDFTNFLASLALAREAVLAGGARAVLVVCGAAMSRHIEPGSGYAVSIGDAAAAAVVGPASRFLIHDCELDTESALYDAAVVAIEPAGAFFRLAPERLAAVHDHGIERPPAVVRRLLARSGVAPGDVTLITHQPTRVLMEHWREDIRPGAYLDTYDTLGNATAASIPATFALRRDEIGTPWVLLMSPGPGMHVAAVLLKR